MFKSSYASMLEKANKHFKKQSVHADNKVSDENLKVLLKKAVKAAVNFYQKKSEKRQNDIDVIGVIFEHCNTVDDCRKMLELYFSGKSVQSLFEKQELSVENRRIIDSLPADHYFKTGLMDGSKLEDYVVAVVDSFYEHIIQPLRFEEKTLNEIGSIKSALLECLKNAKYEALNKKVNNQEIAISYLSIVSKINAITKEQDLQQIYQDLANTENGLAPFFKKNIKPIIDKNIRFHETYDEQDINYEFKDFLQFHLEKYEQEKATKKGHYKLDQGVIDSLDGANNLECIRGTMDMSPLLKKHLVNAENEFNQNQSVRQVKIKTWEDPKTVSNPPKIIIALHGWRDSVECWNNLGQDAIKKGYKVIAYDHRGYGFDSERRDTGHNNDYLSIDFRKFLQSVMKQYPASEINLVGHSMGGAILLNNQDFIASQRNALGQPINSVTCFSPAVTPSIPSFAAEVRNALLGRNAHEEALARQQNNQPRFVTDGIAQPRNMLKIITTLPYLLSMMSQAYQSLKSLVSKTQTAQDSQEPVQPTPWRIFYGERDKAVPFSSFVEVQKHKQNAHVSFEKFPRGDHLLTQGRHSAAALDKFFKEIGSKNNSAEHEEQQNTITSNNVIN